MFLDNYDAILLWSLHGYLIPYKKTNMERSTSKLTKPSISDSQESFLIIAENCTEAEKIIRRKTEIRKSIQPFLLCIGTAIDNITEIYIYFDQIKYGFKLFTRAVDIVFKIFHLFNLKYPEACLTFWTFVEKFFF